MVAMIRSLAQLRSRNVEWAEKAVRDAATLTAPEALKDNVIEIVAGSVDNLLAQADGRKVMVDSKEVTLATKGATIVTYEPDWRTRALSAIADPNIAFLLLMIGLLRHSAGVLASRHVRSRRDRRHQPDPGADRALGSAPSTTARSGCSFSASRS